MNIVVVGGGTAGWITALYAKKIFNNDNVTVIESSKIGILGAGEGATPQLLSLLNYLDINFFEMIKETDSSIKNAIKFINWSDNNFYHSFFDPYKIDSFNYGDFINDFESETIDYAYPYCKKNNKDINKYFLSNYLCEKNKVPFANNANSNIKWSIHFNAKKTAEFLKNIAISRDVLLIDDEVINLKQNEYGNIYKINLASGKEIDSDFVFDCSGFHRLIIGKLFNSEWNSHSKYLPAKMAIPFFLPINKNIEPYTSSIAMNYGWLWKIPVQDRYGCGYVFDTDFISEDKAKIEVEQFLGFEIESPKTITFNPGAYKEIWIKNCLAVGLSSGFVEPLEATSLWQMVRVLLRFFSNKNNINEKNEKIKKIFNKKYIYDTNEVVSFLHLHYRTKKNNTVFWKDFSKNNSTPSEIEELLDLIKYQIPTALDFKTGGMFPYSSYMSIIFGNNIIDKKVIDKYKFEKNKALYLEKRKNEINKLSNLFLEHKNFLR